MFDPKDLRIETFHSELMKVTHIPTGSWVEERLREGESYMALRERLLEELAKNVVLTP